MIHAPAEYSGRLSGSGAGQQAQGPEIKFQHLIQIMNEILHL